MAQAANKKVVLTHRDILRGDQFWIKLAQEQCDSDQHVYWISKLIRLVDAAKKRVYKEALKHDETLGLKFGKKNEKGEFIKREDGMIQIAEENQKAQMEAVDAFLDTPVELVIDALPLSYFSHIKKTPKDMELFEKIADISEKDFTPGKPLTLLPS